MVGATGSGKQAAEALKAAPPEAELSDAVARLRALDAAQRTGADGTTAVDQVASAFVAALKATAARLDARLADQRAALKAHFDPAVFLAAAKADVQQLQELCDLTAPAGASGADAPVQSRFGDTVDTQIHIDQGRADFFSKASSLTEPVEAVRAALQGCDGFVACAACGNGIQVGNKEKHKQKCKKLQPDEVATGRYVEQTAEWVLSMAAGKPEPFLFMYTMETGLCYDTNAAMRRLAFQGDADGYAAKADFAVSLHRALMRRPKYVGTVFRAMNFRVSPAAYRVGGIVTMPQPTSTSTNPQVVKQFLGSGGGGGGAIAGTILILRVSGARDIAPYSVYPEEGEVLIPANSQFRVVGRPDVGVLQLLESALGASLADVAVVELREVNLYHWGNVASVLTPVERIRNALLLGKIDTALEQVKGDGDLDLVRTLGTSRHPVTQDYEELLKPPCTTLPRLEDLGVSRNETDDLKAVADIDWPALLRDDGESSLLDLAAAVSDNEEVVCLILCNVGGASLAADLDSALLVALASNAPRDDGSGSHAGTAAVLLTKGARVQSLPAKYVTPTLARIACYCPTDVVRRVRDDLGDVFWNADGTAGNRTVLHAAAEAGRADIIADVLLPAQRIDLAAEDASGRVAAECAVAGGHLDVVRVLLAEWREGGGGGRPAMLETAARLGRTEVIQALLDAGADVTAGSPCAAAAGSGNAEALKQLLDAGASPNAAPPPGGDGSSDTHDLGTTPLHEAIRAGSRECVALLLAAGADVTAKAKNYSAALDAEDVTAVHAAAEKGDDVILKAVLAAGGALDATDSFNFTPVKRAAMIGHADVILTLGKAGAVVNPATADESGFEAIHIAALGGHADAMRALLAVGADPNLKLDGLTAAVLCAAGLMMPALKVLIDAGCEGLDALVDMSVLENLENAHHVTFLGDTTYYHFAVLLNSHEVVAALLAAGAPHVDTPAELTIGSETTALSPAALAVRVGASKAVLEALLGTGKVDEAKVEEARANVGREMP